MEEARSCSNMPGILTERRNVSTDRHRGRRPTEHEGRDQGPRSTGQGVSKIASKPPEARREAWNRLALSALKRNRPYQHLDVTRLASKTGRQYLFVV